MISIAFWQASARLSDARGLHHSERDGVISPGLKPSISKTGALK